MVSLDELVYRQVALLDDLRKISRGHVMPPGPVSKWRTCAIVARRDDLRPWTRDPKLRQSRPTR